MLNLPLWQQRFRTHLEVSGLAARTIEGYIMELRPLFIFLIDQGIEQLPDVTRTILESYRSELFNRRHRGRPLTVHTQAARLSSVKAFTRFLFLHQYILVDPGAMVELPRLPERLPQGIPSPAEVRQLIEAPAVPGPLGVRDRAILELLYGTGIRNTELCMLQLLDVDLAHRQLMVRQGKGGKDRIVPLGFQALEAVQRWLTRGRPLMIRNPSEVLLFVSVRGMPLERNSVAVLVRSAGRHAGLERVITPHHLRHACATHMLRNGAGLRHLQALLGHKSPAITQRYTRVELTDLRKVIDECHPRERTEETPEDATS